MRSMTVWTASTLAAMAAMGEITTVSSVEELSTPSPYGLGAGMLRYTGASGRSENAFTLSPGANNAATIEVTEPTTTLELDGNFQTTSGAFIKSGPGTLKLGNTGATKQQVGKAAHLSKDAAANFGLDVTTGLPTATSYGAFNVAEGRLVLDGAGQNYDVPTWSDIGMRGYQKSAFLDIIGCNVVFGSDYLNLCCGNGKKANDVGSWMSISGGADVRVPVMRLLYRQWQGNGGDNFYGRAHLVVDGAKMTTVSGVTVKDAGEASIVVTNGAYFTGIYSADSGKTDSQGVLLGSDCPQTTSSSFSVVDHSTGVVYAVEARHGQSVHIGEDSRLEFAHPGLSYLNDVFKGTASIDGGTLANVGNTVSINNKPLGYGQWFTGMDEITVGAKGATFESQGLDALGPRIKAAAGVTSGPIAKTGVETLGIRPTALPLSVQTGVLRFGSLEVNHDGDYAGEVTFSGTASAEIAGHRSAGAMTLSSASTVALLPAGDEGVRGIWARNGWASVRPDGRLQLADFGTSTAIYPFGSVFRTEKVSVNGSFKVTFDAMMRSNRLNSPPVNGSFALVFQNSAAGTAAVGVNKQNGMDAGYTGTVSNKAFAVIVSFTHDGNKGYVQFAKDGVLSAATEITKIYGARFFDLGLQRPFACTFDYDAAAHQASFTMRRPDSTTECETWTYDVDLASQVQGTDAYMGFTGSGFGGWRNATPIISAVRYGETALPPLEKVGGKIALSAGGTQSFKLDGRTDREGFLMKSLAYGEGSVVDAGALHAARGVTSALGFEAYAGSGTLVKRGAASLLLSDGSASGVALKVEQGGLVLRQSARETPASLFVWDWSINERGDAYNRMIGAHGGLMVGGIPSDGPFNANSRHQVNVQGSWQLSFDVYPQGYVSTGEATPEVGDTLGFALHDDARGAETVGNTGSEHGGMVGVKNAFGGVLGVYKWGGTNKLLFSLNASGGKDKCGDFTSNIIVSGDRIHVQMAYDDVAKTLTYQVKHADNDEVTFVMENVDVATRIPSGRARLGFSTASSGNRRIVAEFANVVFARTDGGSEAVPASTSAELASLTATCASLPVVCDTAAGASLRLAETVTLAADGELAISALQGAAAVAMGTLSSANAKPALALGENVTAAVDSASGTKILTVKGGKLRLASANALGAKTRVVLLDDAALELDFEGRLACGPLSRNGARVSGPIDAAHCDWVSGTGSILAGSGMLLLVR